MQAWRSKTRRKVHILSAAMVTASTRDLYETPKTYVMMIDGKYVSKAEVKDRVNAFRLQILKEREQ